MLSEPCRRQNVHWHERGVIASGASAVSNATRSWLQWHEPFSVGTPASLRPRASLRRERDVARLLVAEPSDARREARVVAGALDERFEYGARAGARLFARRGWRTRPRRG